MLPDRVFYPLVALTAALMIALAMVWPQGEGTRSPGRFGHAVRLPADAARPIVTPSPAKPSAKHPPAS